MRSKVQHIFQEIQRLSTTEQIEILQKISNHLYNTHLKDKDKSPFWRTKSIEELQTEQATKPVTDFTRMTGRMWPPDEDFEEFLADLKSQRKEALIDEPGQ